MGSRRQAVFSISGMMFQIPLKLETARWWFGPVALLFARYSPLRGCSSQTPSHRVKLLRDQLPPSTLIGTREFWTEGNEMNEGGEHRTEWWSNGVLEWWAGDRISGAQDPEGDEDNGEGGPREKKILVRNGANYCEMVQIGDFDFRLGRGTGVTRINTNFH
jgi:hypothetical protein